VISSTGPAQLEARRLCNRLIYAPSGNLCAEAYAVASGPGPITRSTLLDEVSSMFSCQLPKGDARHTSSGGVFHSRGGL
jgi:hypothetical protein